MSVAQFRNFARVLGGNTRCCCPLWAYALLNMDKGRSQGILAYLATALYLSLSEAGAGVWPLFGELGTK